MKAVGVVADVIVNVRDLFLKNIEVSGLYFFAIFLTAYISNHYR